MCADAAARSTGEQQCGEQDLPEEDTQTNNFKYDHKLSLLSAVGIKSCLIEEKFTVSCREWT